MPSIEPKDHPAFDEFVATIAALRAPDGCPWDREQTHASIAANMVEEAYEAVDAIEQADVTHLREELGDVLLQVVLQSQIAADGGEFTIDDVCRDVNAKMIRRHPHVFGDMPAGNANEVLAVWDKIKLQEQADAKERADAAASSTPAGLLDSIPSAFPALTLAQKISRKAAAVGFEWESVQDVWDKVDEEVAELQEAYALAPKDGSGKVVKDVGAADNGDGACASASASHAPTYADVELEFGDVLFSLVNVGRRMGLNAEAALRATCQKFRKRWEYMERVAADQGISLEGLDAEELERLWQAAKIAP